MNYYLTVLKKYAIFDGRSQRAEYWFFFLFNFIIVIILMSVDHAMGNLDSSKGVGGGGYSTIYYLAFFIPHVAVIVRRLHDTDHSGWWFFLNLIPIVGNIWLIVLLATDSKPGENQYGPNPKGIMAR